MIDEASPPPAAREQDAPLPPRRSRREYLDWVAEQVDAHKEQISRSELLALADQVVAEIGVNPRGQYQLTEMILCAAVDRHIFRLLRLPSYRRWLAERTGE